MKLVIHIKRECDVHVVFFYDLQVCKTCIFKSNPIGRGIWNLQVFAKIPPSAIGEICTYICSGSIWM